MAATIPAVMTSPEMAAVSLPRKFIRTPSFCSGGYSPHRLAPRKPDMPLGGAELDAGGFTPSTHARTPHPWFAGFALVRVMIRWAVLRHRLGVRDVRWVTYPPVTPRVYSRS